MSNEIIGVEKTSSGFLIRYASGGSRSLSVGGDASLIHYSNDSITYSQGGKTKHYNLNTNAVRVVG